MNKRGTGVILIAVAAMLFAARYITAAIYLSNVMSWDASLFSAGLHYVGDQLWVLSAISFLSGLGYLIVAERNKEK